MNGHRSKKELTAPASSSLLVTNALMWSMDLRYPVNLIRRFPRFAPTQTVSARGITQINVSSVMPIPCSADQGDLSFQTPAILFPPALKIRCSDLYRIDSEGKTSYQ